MLDKSRLKDPTQIVLEYLRVGGEVEIKGHKVSIIMTDTEQKALVIKGEKYTLGREDETKEEVFFDFPIKVSDFINECDKFNGEELVIMASNTTLKKIALGEK
jgi:hypothetical protein